MKVLYLVDWDAGIEAEATWKGLVAFLRVLGVEPQIAVWHRQERFDPASFDVGAHIWPIRAGHERNQGRHELKRLALELAPDYVHNTAFELNFLAWRACHRGSTWALGSAERSVRCLRTQHGRLAMFLRSAFPNIQVCATPTASNDLIQSLPRHVWPWVHVAPLPVPESYFDHHRGDHHQPGAVLLCGGESWGGPVSPEQQLADALLAAGTSANVIRIPAWPDPKTTHHVAHEIHSTLHHALCLVYAGDPGDAHFVVPKVLASGIPVLAASEGELARMVHHGITGELVDQLSVPKAAAVVSQWISHPEARQQMGQAARKQAHVDYSAEAVAASYVEIYRLVDTWKHKDGKSRGATHES